MMKDLLEGCFGKHYGYTAKVTADGCCHQGVFCCHDEKACANCKRPLDGMALCNQVVLTCDSGDNEVEVVDLEKFFNGFKKLQGKRCDKLLSGNDKVVFCEMTCSLAKHTMDSPGKVGKRNVAKEQIGHSIKLLFDVPEIKRELDSKNEKTALFAYRERPEVQNDEFDKTVIARMRSFSSMDAVAYSQPMYSAMENGFSFMEVRYPSVYRW